MALSVARSLVTSAVNKAASEAMDELALLMGVRTEIWYIKDELRIMQAFLKTAEKMKDRDELVKVWAEQVEDLSYDIKYCLDEFMFNLGHPGCLQRLTKLRVRHQIAVQIRNLKVRVGEVSARIQRYSHLMKPITMDETRSCENETSSYMDNHNHSNAYEQLPREFRRNQELEAFGRMDIVTYHHLPSHLKPCSLYLCIFAVDSRIQTRRLIDRWIAEGFVTSRFGMDTEDVAMSYIYELINKGMIQPSRVNVQGEVKSFLVNGVFSNMMASVSRDENFVYLSKDLVKSAPEENFRHVAHHGKKCPKISMDWSHVRSFTVFAVSPMDPAPSICSANLRMLSVLDLEGAQGSITQKDFNNIGLLRRLKYVNVRGHSDIRALPGAIGKLHGLQYLDVRNSSITSLPTEITRVHSLISLRCGRKKIDLHGLREGTTHTWCLPMVFPCFATSSIHAESVGVRVPRGICDLQELRILEIVDIKITSSRAIKERGELAQLRKLSVVTAGATVQKCNMLCAAIEKVTSLCSLTVDAGKSSLVWLHTVPSPPLLLRTLKLVGCLGEKIPDWFSGLGHLEKILLEHSGIKGEAQVMYVLGSLPNLVHICLSEMSYVEKELIFRAEMFHSLKKLVVSGLPQLRTVRFEQGSSPRLERIEIDGCSLQSGIRGIRCLPSLLDISLGQGCQVAELGELQGEVEAHPNRHVLKLLFDRSYHDLGDLAECSNAVQVQDATGESSHFPESAQVVC